MKYFLLFIGILATSFFVVYYTQKEDLTDKPLPQQVQKTESELLPTEEYMKLHDVYVRDNKTYIFTSMNTWPRPIECDPSQDDKKIDTNSLGGTITYECSPDSHWYEPVTEPPTYEFAVSDTAQISLLVSRESTELDQPINVSQFLRTIKEIKTSAPLWQSQVKLFIQDGTVLKIEETYSP